MIARGIPYKDKISTALSNKSIATKFGNMWLDAWLTLTAENGYELVVAT